jgi:hypothetical protein
MTYIEVIEFLMAPRELAQSSNPADKTQVASGLLMRYAYHMHAVERAGM